MINDTAMSQSRTSSQIIHYYAFLTSRPPCPGLRANVGVLSNTGSVDQFDVQRVRHEAKKKVWRHNYLKQNLPLESSPCRCGLHRIKIQNQRKNRRVDVGRRRLRQRQVKARLLNTQTNSSAPGWKLKPDVYFLSRLSQLYFLHVFQRLLLCKAV